MKYKDPSGNVISKSAFDALQSQIQGAGGAGKVSWTGTGYVPSTDYSASSGPTTGKGAFGLVPGAISIPPNLYSQVSDVYPDIGSQAQLAGRDIGAGLAGEVSPSTLYALQSNAARFGQTSGMPLSGLQTNMGLLSLGTTAEAQQAKAMQQYEALTKSLGSLMTPQDLAASIASRNATMAAAPDPRMAAEQQMQDWMQKFNLGISASRPAAGTGGYSIGGGGKPVGGGGFDTTGVSGPGGVGNPPGMGGIGVFSNYNPSASYLNSLYANLPGQGAYDPYAEGEPMAGDISDPYSAWWDEAGGLPANTATTPDVVYNTFGLPTDYGYTG